MRKLLLLLMMFCCTACTALPAEERAFAVALCAEKQGEAWQMHARIPAYKTGGEYLTVSGKGKDVALALADLDASAPMQTSLSQLRLLVLSDQLKGADVDDLLTYLADQYDVRLQCAVAMTDASAKAVADALKPDTGARLSKAIDILLESRIRQGSVPKATLAEIIRMGERQSPVLMRLSLQEGKPDLSGAYPLGRGGQILPKLTEEETALLSLLRGDTKELQLSLMGEGVRVRDVCAKAALAEDLRTARVTLTMKVLSSAVSPDDVESALAQACAELLSRLSAEGCDALGLGRKASLCLKDMAAWQEAYPGIQWIVSVRAEGPA